MRLADIDLGAQTTTLGAFLNGEMMRILAAEFEEASRADEGIECGQVPDERILGILDRFWKGALGSAAPFFSSEGRPPVALLKKILPRWADFLRRESRPCLAPGLDAALKSFRDAIALDAARLDDIARRLKLLEEDGPRPLPGRIAVLQDVLRGFPVRLWFEPDADRTDPITPEGVAEALREGSLLLADRRHATPAMLASLARCGASGIFRIRVAALPPLGPPDPPEHLRARDGARTALPPLGPPDPPEHLRARDGARTMASAGERVESPEDREVEVRGNSGPIRLRRISGVEGGKDVAVLTDVLDRERLPAAAALRLGIPAWRIDRLFDDVGSVVDLKRWNGSDLAAVEAQVHTAAILGGALGVIRGWIAEATGVPAASIDPKACFPRLAAGAAAAVGAASSKSRNNLSSGINARFRTAPKSAGHERADRILPRSPRRRVLPTPAAREEMMSIARIDLEPAFEPFCAGYAEVGHRDGFLWKWVQRGVDLTALPSIDPEWRSSNRTAKLLGVMLDVLLDDVADNFKYQDARFLDSLLRIPFDGIPKMPDLDPARLRYHAFTGQVWAEIARLTHSFPRFRELKDLWEFDVRQLLNTMRYGFLVNHFPELLNLTEHDLYQPHNMHMMIFSTQDLMCSSGFDRSEIRFIRRAMWCGQMMGRIGNMVSTWEREIKERDFTSGVFAEAIDRGVVDAGELALLPAEELTSLIERSGVVDHFLERWGELRDEVASIAEKVCSVDLTSYVKGLEELIRNHLGSRGLK
jgi:hypothetical protein